MTTAVHRPRTVTARINPTTPTAPQTTTSTPERPADTEPRPEGAHGSDGRIWLAGERVTFKTNDGFLMTGTITGFGERAGQRTATVLVDTRRVAPASRPIKGIPNRPGKARPLTPPQEWTLPLDAKLTRD